MTKCTKLRIVGFSISHLLCIFLGLYLMHRQYSQVLMRAKIEHTAFHSIINDLDAIACIEAGDLKQAKTNLSTQIDFALISMQVNDSFNNPIYEDEVIRTLQYVRKCHKSNSASYYDQELKGDIENALDQAEEDATNK